MCKNYKHIYYGIMLTVKSGEEAVNHLEEIKYSPKLNFH